MHKKIMHAFIQVSKNLNRIRAVLFIITLLCLSVSTLSYYVEPVKAQPAPTITYDGTNIIVQNGTTHNLFMDIWTAHEANGTWNVMNNTCDHQFKMWCSIQIINSTVSDVNKQVIFETYPFSTISIQYDSNSYVRFGNATDVANKIGSNGIDLWSLESGLNVQFIACSVATFPSGCGVELFGCSFNYPDTSSHGSIGYYVSYNGGNAPIWNCLLRNTNIAYSKVDISEVEMIGTGSGTGTYKFQSGSTVKDLQITNWGYGMYFPTGTYELRDVELLNNTDDFRIVGNGELNCTDFIADWTFSFHSRANMIAYRKYSFDVRTIFENQTSIADCNISLTDIHGTELFNIQTFANGTIPTQIVTYAYYGRTTGDTPNLESPHTLKVFREGMRMYESIFNLTEAMDLTLTLTPRGWHTGTEGITFQAHSIPKVTTSYSDYTFYFNYEDYHLGLRPFAFVNDTLYKMKKIVPFLKSHGANYSWAIKTFNNIIHYGFNITGIPIEIAETINSIGFRIIDYNFPLSAFKKETLRKGDINVTIISIPKINLYYSFEDLQERGYTVDVVNKTYILIGNVNQTDLYLDPITYSSPLITIVGFTRDNACTFQDVCDVNDREGWGVVDAIDLNEFLIEARLQIGDGSTETWFADEAVRVVMVSSFASADDMIRITSNAYLRFGRVLNNATKTTDRGVTLEFRHTLGWSLDYLIMHQSGAGLLELYGSSIRGTPASDARSHIAMSEDANIYGCIFDECYLAETPLRNYDIYRTTIFTPAARYTGYGIKYPSGTLDDVLIYSTIWAIDIFSWQTATVTNGVFKNNSYLVWAASLTGSLTLRNCESDAWNFRYTGSCTGEIYRQYSFDLTVVALNGSAIENANVTISNTFLGTSNSWLTNSTGQMPTQNYNYGHYNQTGGDALFNYNPYNITITLEGFDTYILLYNHTEITDLTLALVATIPEEAAPLRTVFLMFFIALLFSIIYETKRYKAWSGIVSSGCWIILGLSWFILAASQVRVIGLLWNGIGIFYIVRWMIDLIGMRSIRKGRRLGDDDIDSL